MSDELERTQEQAAEEKSTADEGTPTGEEGQSEAAIVGEGQEGEARGTQEEDTASAGSEQTEERGAPQPVSSVVTDNDRMWALLAYFIPLLVPIFVLMVEPNRHRPFQRYHAIHSLVFTVAVLAYEIALTVVFLIIGAIPIVSCLLFCLWPLVFLPVLLYLWYGVQAYQGQWITIPVLTDMIRQQGWIA